MRSLPVNPYAWMIATTPAARLRRLGVLAVRRGGSQLLHLLDRRRRDDRLAVGVEVEEAAAQVGPASGEPQNVGMGTAAILRYPP